MECAPLSAREGLSGQVTASFAPLSRREGRALSLSVLLLLAAVEAAVSLPARALDPTRLVTQYPMDRWQSEQGLPQNTIVGIAETPDGYLWAATQEGLARFDGVSFTVFDKDNTPAILSSSMHALCATRDGTLWFGTAGGGLGSVKGGAFQRYGAKEGLTSPYVSVLASGNGGDLWVGTYGAGVAYFSSGRFEPIAEPQGLPGSLIVALCPGREGAWVATSKGDVALVAQGGVTKLAWGAGPASRGIGALLEDRSGVLWIGTTGEGLMMRRPGRAVEMPPAGLRLPGASVSCLMEDREGALWIGTEAGGLYRLFAGRLELLGPDQGMPASPVRALYEDPGGNLWIGSDGAGLMRLMSGRFTTFSTSEGLSSDYAVGVTESSGGGLWVATHGGGLNYLRGDRVRAYRTADGLSSDVLWSLLEARDGTLWVGTDGRGLCTLKGGRLSRFGLGEGFAALIVDSLFEDRTGAIWVGTNGDGAFRIRKGGLDHFGRAEGLASPVVHIMLEDSKGALWCGTEGGLARFDGQRFAMLTTEDGLPSDMILALYEDPGGALWIGTGQGGLSVYKDGRLHTIAKKQGLFDNTVLQILPDDRGYFWMSSNRGIFRALRDDLLATAEGRRARVECLAYGRSNGMKSAECNGGISPAGTRLKDGRLCFPTIRGVVFVDPAAESALQIPPKVLVERVSFAGRGVDRSASISLPPGVRQFEVRFTGLSYYAPERLAFRYRLEGLDSSWVEAGGRRVAYYTNLRPGRYVFAVEAAGTDGVWSPKGDQLELVVPPRFFETRAFYVCALLVLLLLMAFAYATSVRGLRLRQRRLETEVARRTSELQEANSALEDRTRDLEALNVELERLSTEDSLTGLANRRYFDDRLDQEWRRGERTGTSLALVSMDVDYFKQFNDAHGHPMGDACLQRLGDHLTGAFGRAGDLAARLGGDEFCVILADTSLEEAAMAAERLRVAFEGLAIPHGESDTSAVVTLSLGVAAGVPGPRFTADALLSVVDRALYLAKEQGRNRVCALPLELNTAPFPPGAALRGD